MDKKIEKLRELLKSKYAKPILFFGFYFIFFAVIFSLPTNNPNNNNNEEDKDVLANINNNYEYLYSITNEDGQVIEIEGKKYYNKNLFTKKIDDINAGEFYIFYDNIKTKTDEGWEKTSDLVLVDTAFNEQWFDINYLKNIIGDAELIETETNFDGSTSEIYKFSNIDLEVIGDKGILKRINVTFPPYKIVLQYRNINSVKDFVVEE